MVDRSEHAARTQRDATSRSAASPRTSLDTPTPRTPARQPLLEGRSGEWHAAGRSTAASRVRRDRLALCLAGGREVSVECPSDSARWRDSMRDAERRIRCDTRDSRQSPWSGAGPILHGMQEVRGSNPLSSTPRNPLFLQGISLFQRSSDIPSDRFRVRAASARDRARAASRASAACRSRPSNRCP